MVESALLGTGLMVESALLGTGLMVESALPGKGLMVGLQSSPHHHPNQQ
jgi:hypothetical protein